MNKSRCEFYKSFIGENSSDQRKTLLNHTHEVHYPPFKDKLTFANEMGSYFIEKIDYIQAKLESCKLDPMPTPLAVNCIDSLVPVITKIINLSLSNSYVSDEWKCAIVYSLLKKPDLDLVFKSYRPVSNLPYVSKLTERAVHL